MQLLQKQGPHPAKGSLTAPTENSRTVFGLHKQGQQWARSRGSFMNVSVGKMARVEMAPAAAGRAVPGSAWLSQASAEQQKFNTPLITGTTVQMFPRGTVEREANVPSWTKFCSSWPAVSLTGGHDLGCGAPCPGGGCSTTGSQHTAGRALEFAQPGRAARCDEGG